MAAAKRNPTSVPTPAPDAEVTPDTEPDVADAPAEVVDDTVTAEDSEALRDRIAELEAEVAAVRGNAGQPVTAERVKVRVKRPNGDVVSGTWWCPCGHSNDWALDTCGGCSGILDRAAL